MRALHPTATLSLAVAAILGCGEPCPPVEADPWNSCGERLDAPECAIVLPVSIGSVPSDPVIACAGFEPIDGNDPCVWFPGIVGPVFRDGRFLYPFQGGAVTHGFRFDLEVEMTGPDAGRARFCREQFTDVGGEGCPLSNWSCARSGAITLSAPPSSEPGNPRAIHGEIHVEFPGGESVDAVF